MPRIFGFSLGFLLDKPLRRKMAALGWPVRVGLPGQGDAVAIWGRKPVAKRGQAVARWCNVPVISFEDGFLRSVRTGRQGAAGLSLIVDDLGIYFDTAHANRLQRLIEQTAGLSTKELERAQNGIDLLRRHHLSKYNDFPLQIPDLPDEFVLLVDQTRNDASLDGAGAGAADFKRMLTDALADYPDMPVVVKTHPETQAGMRAGHFDGAELPDRVILLDYPCSPWVLFERAKAVYVVSSQLGLEAIFAGHKPVTYGRAFYAGFGLTTDRHPDQPPHAPRSAAQIFHAAYLQYTRWYDPFFDCETGFETTARTLAAQAGWWRETRQPTICIGMRLWKRGFLKNYLAKPRYIEDTRAAVAMARKTNARIAIWAGKESAELREQAAAAKVPLLRIEDGFLRSAGLGAELVRPVSLAFDDLGIYYDPTRESRLERLISASVDLPEYALKRAEALRQSILAAGLSKYNLGGETPQLSVEPEQQTILVPGQVEDDASILKGAGKVRSNLDLLSATRAAFPDAWLVYKPHPDVQKGLRKGALTPEQTAGLADLVLPEADISALLDQVDMVATITSLTGFEALLRGKKVACFGVPFYAGWGLTQDFAKTPERRQARPALAALIHATLIGYPRYWDPVTGMPCPVEVVQKRLADGDLGRGSGPAIRLLAKLQGLFSSFAHLWR